MDYEYFEKIRDLLEDILDELKKQTERGEEVYKIIEADHLLTQEMGKRALKFCDEVDARNAASVQQAIT